MTQTSNTATEIKIKNAFGVVGSNRLRCVIRAGLKIFSYAPLQSIRIVALRMAGARIGKDIVLGIGVEVLSPWRLRIGSHTNIGRHVRLDARGDLAIGDNVNISDEVAIWTAEHDIHSPDFAMVRAEVVIEDRVWLGFRSIILPGICLGNGCVVASGAVVTKDVSFCLLVGGVPAKVIGTRSKILTYQLGNPKNTSRSTAETANDLSSTPRK
jgi:putative colanic acid biosynthesis acetyltransferase WcaF